jgi:superfamily II DNA helicase RecQ
MHEQYHLRCKENGLTCKTWSYTMSAMSPPQNILATIEEFDKQQFHKYIIDLVDSRLLARLIVDEVHLAMTHASFHDVMDTLTWLGAIGIQILLMSGTVPPSLEVLLFKKFGLMNYIICEEKTSRPNICYSIIMVSDIYEELQLRFKQLGTMSGSQKAVIYCQSKEAAATTSRCLGIPHCDRMMSRSEINEVLTKLRMGAVKAVVCTTVLSVALNVSDLKYVFHLDYPYDMLSYIQESG